MAQIFVLIGASGVGKTTLAKQVVQNSEYLIMPVGITTRKPRLGEKQFIDYHFISQTTFREWKRAERFIETTTVRGEHYGYLKKDILDPLNAGYDLLLILTNDGLEICEKLFGEQVTSIFIAPPSREILAQRRLKRDTNAVSTFEDDIFGETRFYKYKLVNDDLKITCQIVCSIIQKEQKRRNDMLLKHKELTKLAKVSRQQNVMIEHTEDGRCLRIYPEFDSKSDGYVQDPLEEDIKL